MRFYSPNRDISINHEAGVIQFVNQHGVHVTINMVVRSGGQRGIAGDVIFWDEFAFSSTKHSGDAPTAADSESSDEYLKHILIPGLNAGRVLIMTCSVTSKDDVIYRALQELPKSVVTIIAWPSSCPECIIAGIPYKCKHALWRLCYEDKFTFDQCLQGSTNFLLGATNCKAFIQETLAVPMSEQSSMLSSQSIDSMFNARINLVERCSNATAIILAIDPPHVKSAMGVWCGMTIDVNHDPCL